MFMLGVEIAEGKYLQTWEWNRTIILIWLRWNAGELTVRWNLNHYARLVKYGPDRKPCNAGARNDRLFCVFGVTFKFNDTLKWLSMIIFVLEIFCLSKEIQWSTLVANGWKIPAATLNSIITPVVHLWGLFSALTPLGNGFEGRKETF